MAAALHTPRNDPAPYSRAVMTDLDFRDHRYPQTKPAKKAPSASSSTTSDTQQDAAAPPRPAATWSPEPFRGIQVAQPAPHSSTSQGQRRSPSPRSSSPEAQQRSALSYTLPAPRRVVERYGLDSADRQPSGLSPESKPLATEFPQDTPSARSQPESPSASRVISASAQERDRTRLSPVPRASLAPQPDVPPPVDPGVSQFPPIMPLAASPTYNPPVSPNPRAYAQQPKYAKAPNPVQPVYTPIMPPQEEVCVECAMRDQDMADVDVTSPGMWERASDALYEDLLQRELEDEANGVPTESPNRVQARGGKLTEQNLKVWLSINPREPASRQQTLLSYIKSQRSMLEAEAVAHARAVQEAKQLDSTTREAYGRLRRSVYDTAGSSHPPDDGGGLRIHPPMSPHDHTRTRSREVTLLENGMIVEHVDIRKEEKEARERRRREERRARKSSRSSAMDGTSVISAQSGGALVEGNLEPYSRYSRASSMTRPMSVLTTQDRPDLPRAYSQASFSDVHSLSSASPRRTRFFGIKNLSTGWRSQDSLAPSGVSGSMLDMHVALQRETGAHGQRSPTQIDLNTPRKSQIWPPTDVDEPSIHTPADDKKKKKGGLAKIWRLVTGKGDNGQRQDQSQRQNGQDDDFLLTPPPPLSYLVDRGPVEMQTNGNMRHTSNPSLPSLTSPKFGLSSSGMSPPTAPSSLLPSPASARPSGLDPDVVEHRLDPEDGIHDDTIGKGSGGNMKTFRSISSEVELRIPSNGNTPTSPRPPSMAHTIPRPQSLSRDKSLPPLPPGESPMVLPYDCRPKTFYALPPGTGAPHDFLPPHAPFRTGDTRRQSFGGSSNRPNLTAQTLPASRSNGFDRRSFAPRYDDFGQSRRSLGRLDHVQETSRNTSPVPSAKRRSKFGFSSLLGKKEKKEDTDKHQFPAIGYAMYDQGDDLNSNGYAHSNSRHSTFSVANPSRRMSVASRKALEELVQQDADFVAYRYPSAHDQRLDIQLR